MLWDVNCGQDWTLKSILEKFLEVPLPVGQDPLVQIEESNPSITLFSQMRSGSWFCFRITDSGKTEFARVENRGDIYRRRIHWSDAVVDDVHEKKAHLLYMILSSQKIDIEGRLLTRETFLQHILRFLNFRLDAA